MLVLLCGLVAAAVRLAEPEPRVRVRESTDPTRTVVVLPPGQAKVTGTVESLTSEADAVDPITVPFVVGADRAVIGGALVEGRRTTAEWDGQRTLRLEGGSGGLDPSPATVGVGKGYVVVRLDGSPRPILPGGYRTSAPVVVGAGSLGAPQEGLAFEADGSTTLEAEGTIWGDPRRLRLEGPGTVELVGRLSVRTRDGDRRATRLRFGPGPFEVDLTPRPDGTWTLDATLQGPLDVQG